MLSKIAEDFGSLPPEARTELIREWATKYLEKDVDYIVFTKEECEQHNCSSGTIALTASGIRKISKIVNRCDIYEITKQVFESGVT